MPWPSKTEIQTLLFDARRWAPTDAQRWALKHGFKASQIDQPAEYLRIRQHDPSQYMKDRMRTIALSEKDGIKAVVGVPKQSTGRQKRRRNPTDDALEELRRAGRRERTRVVEEGLRIPLDAAGAREAFERWSSRTGYGYPGLDAADYAASVRAFTQGFVGRRRNRSNGTAAMASILLPLLARYGRDYQTRFLKAGTAQRRKMVRRLASGSLPLRMALQNDKRADHAAAIVYEAIKSGAVDQAVSAATPVRQRANPVSNEEAKAVAMTIIQQMGGWGRIRAMTGAKNLLYGTTEGKGKGDPMVSFQFSNRKGPNMVRVIYRLGRDTYTVEFFRRRGYDAHPKGTFDDVYADGLKPLFERQTGLYLSL